MLNQSSRHQLSHQGFLPGPVFPGYRIEHHDGLHLLVIDHQPVSCTPTQYQIALCLLEHAGDCATFEELMLCFNDAVSDVPDLFLRDRRKLIKVISDLRLKLWSHGLAILYVGGIGYQLIGRPSWADVSEEQRPTSPSLQAPDRLS